MEVLIYCVLGHLALFFSTERHKGSTVLAVPFWSSESNLFWDSSPDTTGALLWGASHAIRQQGRMRYCNVKYIHSSVLGPEQKINLGETFTLFSLIAYERETWELPPWWRPWLACVKSWVPAPGRKERMDWERLGGARSYYLDRVSKTRSRELSRQFTKIQDPNQLPKWNGKSVAFVILVVGVKYTAYRCDPRVFSQ